MSMQKSLSQLEAERQKRTHRLITRGAAVEKVERGKKAQLAYGFDIALQNEFSMEENIALARQFLLEQFVSRGMIVDFAVHSPEKESGISNPHFHVMCPIRPIEANGKWGNKQRREYVLDESGNRIPDGTGDYVFNAVPTTDWGSPETLEHWRQAWAELCNAKFEEKGLPVRLDHRSYERQGLDLLPTIHEGPTVRSIERKGIATEKGEFNRWVKATNAAIRDIRKKIAALVEWLKEVRGELSKPKAPDLVSLLQAYFDRRNAGAYSQKARINNLKEMNALFNYLMEHGIHDLDTLEDRVNTLRESSDALKETLDSQTARTKEIRKLPEYLSTYREMKPVYDGLQKIKFTRSKEKYKSDHAAELKQFYEARRKLSAQFPDGIFDQHKLDAEYSRLEQAHAETYAQFKSIREAAEYSNIGINKIDELLKQPNCPFVLYVGTKKLVKRRAFEEFIEGRVAI